MTWILLLVAIFIGPGCASEPGPKVVVDEVYRILDDYASDPNPQWLRAVYDRLDTPSRAVLDAQAAAHPAAGLEPWQYLTYRGLMRGDRVDAIEVLDASETEAAVRITFAHLMPGADGKPRAAPDPVELRVVRQEDRWRVSLPLQTR